MQSDFVIPRPATKQPVQPAAPQPDRHWYVRLDNTVYGPFDDRTVWTYVQEGRVTALSDLSMRPDGGYQPAGNWLEIAHWFHTVAADVPQEPEPEPEPELPRYSALMMVMAEINSGRDAYFEQTLQSVGDAYRVGETLYMVRCDVAANELRSILGPTLAVNDRMLVADASHASFAGYNLGSETEETLAIIEDGRV